MAVFTVIDHTELTGATASWSETGISSAYDHLLIKASMRCDLAGNYGVTGQIQLNGETANTNYTYVELYAATGTPAATWLASEPTIGYPWMPAASVLADTFATLTVWIPNYANTSNFKQVRWFNAFENDSTTNSQWGLKLAAGLWSNTDAIDEILISPATGWSTDFVQYSTFTLYGVKGA
jgi:hypothetical protein